MRAAPLSDRGVIKVGGDDARNFLHGLVTADVINLQPQQARYCALLTPQGKIIADFIVVAAQDGSGFFLDLPKSRVATLLDKLKLYKLRAKVVVEDRSETLAVMAAWDGVASSRYGLCYPDPRLPELGLRVLLRPDQIATAPANFGATLADAAEYESHRIKLGIPQGGSDFGYGDAFPHEADMDQLGGIDFAKGCYIGQEVISRMEHRGTARTRAVPVGYAGAAPEPGTPITAGGRQLGVMGSARDGHGIAVIRLDRTAEALSSGERLSAAGVAITLVKPDWAHFAFPGDSRAAE